MYSELLTVLKTIESATKSVIDNSQDFEDKKLDIECTILNSAGAYSLKLLEQSIEKLESLLGQDGDFYKDIFETADSSMEISEPDDLEDKLEEIREDLSGALTDYLVEIDTVENVRGLKESNLLVEDRLIQDLQDIKDDGKVSLVVKFLS